MKKNAKKGNKSLKDNSEKKQTKTVIGAICIVVYMIALFVVIFILIFNGNSSGIPKNLQGEYIASWFNYAGANRAEELILYDETAEVVYWSSDSIYSYTKDYKLGTSSYSIVVSDCDGNDSCNFDLLNSQGSKEYECHVSFGHVGCTTSSGNPLSFHKE